MQDKQIKLLNSYLDTGLTPEEIKDFKAWLNEDREELNDITIFNDLSELMKYRKTGLTPEEVARLHTLIKQQGEELQRRDLLIKELDKERDYWEREAKKWCIELGKIREDAAKELCD